MTFTYKVIPQFLPQIGAKHSAPSWGPKVYICVRSLQLAGGSHSYPLLAQRLTVIGSSKSYDQWTICFTCFQILPRFPNQNRLVNRLGWAAPKYLQETLLDSWRPPYGLVLERMLTCSSNSFNESRLRVFFRSQWPLVSIFFAEHFTRKVRRTQGPQCVLPIIPFILPPSPHTRIQQFISLALVNRRSEARWAKAVNCSINLDTELAVEC